jgi:hypothetical protein
VPKGNPISVPRTQGPNERFQSSTFIQIEPEILSIVSCAWFNFEAK